MKVSVDGLTVPSEILLLLTLTVVFDKGAIFRAALNVEVVPSSEVLPEMFVISKKSLLGTVGDAGVEGNTESSFRATLNVEVVPSS